MAVPTTYTEETLAQFIIGALSQVGSVLGWTTLADVQDVVDETLLAYGVDTIDAAMEVRKMRTLARREAWRAAAAGLAIHFDFSADGGSYSKEQLYTHAQEMFRQTEQAAYAYDSGYQVGVDRLRYVHDPYRVVDEDERTR